MVNAQIKGMAAPIPVMSKYINLMRFVNDPLTVLRQGYQRHGRIFSLYNGPIVDPVIFALGVENSKTILHDTTTFYNSQPLDMKDAAIEALMEGLTLQNGTHHRQQRRLMMPAFHKQYIETYRDDMVRIANDLLTQWQVGEVRDIQQDMNQVALDIAVTTLLGASADDESHEIGESIHTFIQEIMNPINIMLRFDIPGVPFHNLVETAKDLQAKLQRFIDHKRANLGNDVLSALIASRDEEGQQLSNSELIGQANILFLAGHETTANSMTWTLFLLAQHPQVMATLAEEIKALDGREPTLDDIKNLQYLDWVIKESMRLLPAVPLSLRMSQTPFELEGNQFPAETLVIISNYIIHHMPELYENPQRFIPERWETLKPSAYEYLPFFAGPRMCIGATFAMMEMKIVLTMILQRYLVAAVPDMRVDHRFQVTLKPKDGLPLRIYSPDDTVPLNPVSGTIHDVVDLSC